MKHPLYSGLRSPLVVVRNNIQEILDDLYNFDEAIVGYENENALLLVHNTQLRTALRFLTTAAREQTKYLADNGYRKDYKNKQEDEGP